MFKSYRDSSLAWKIRRTPLWRLYRKRPSLDQEIAFYEGLLGNCGSGCIIDVGASIGSKTEIFRKLGSRVICIEPDPKSADILRKRFKWFRNIEIREFAVSDISGTIPFYSFEPGCPLNTASAEWAERMTHQDRNHMRLAMPKPQTTYVRAEPLSFFIAAAGPVKYLKIDVEGFEQQVLSTLNVSVPLISIEFSFPIAQGALRECAFRACIAMLIKLGNYKFNAAITEPPLKFEFDRWLSGKDMVTALIQTSWLYVELYARTDRP